jgi:hypothetical protein
MSMAIPPAARDGAPGPRETRSAPAARSEAHEQTPDRESVEEPRHAVREIRRHAGDRVQATERQGARDQEEHAHTHHSRRILQDLAKQHRGCQASLSEADGSSAAWRRRSALPAAPYPLSGQGAREALRRLAVMLSSKIYSTRKGLAMRSRRWIGFVLLGLGFLVLAIVGQPSGARAASAMERPPVLLGVGATWTDPGRFRHTLYPGAMAGIDLGLGAHASIGLLGDFTYIDERPGGPAPTSSNHRLITAVDFKVLPVSNRAIRPWLVVSAAGSVVHDTGYGWGIGGGAFILPEARVALFVDARRYHFLDFENPAFTQTTLRAGVAF